MESTFGRYHPVINFVFFIGAIVFGMFFVHPVFLSISVAASVLYYLLLKGRRGVKMLLSLLMLFFIISFMNPLFNTKGDTVLFTWMDGRAFTLEALCYGFATGGMFLTILLWFSCYNAVMSSDKFIYLFGRMIPSLSLVLSMVLRLVPGFQAKITTISGARKCIGKGPDCGDRKEKLLHGMDILSTLTSWALEGAAITADSMKSRGYGSGRRTNFCIYRREKRDVTAAIVLFSGILLTVIGIVSGETKMEYFPVLRFPEINLCMAVGAVGYAMFLFLPSIIQIWEEATWRILKSKI